MASMTRRKTCITTYSRKTKPHVQPSRPSIELSQNYEASVPLISHQSSSINSKKRKRITLTSPEPQNRVPSSLGSLPSDVLHGHHEVDEDQSRKSQKHSKKPKARQPAKRPLRRLPVNELAVVSSEDNRLTRPVSPISDLDSSGNDPISDGDSLARLLFPSQIKSKKHRATTKKHHPLLSTVRKSLKANSVPKRKTRAKATWLPPSTLSNEIQKGADSFTGHELFVPPGSKRKRVRKPRVSAVMRTLDFRKGPHPDVQFGRVGDVQDETILVVSSEQQTNRVLEAAEAGDHNYTSSLPPEDATILQEHPTSTHVEHAKSSSHYTIQTSTRSSSGLTDNHDTASRHLNEEDSQQEQSTFESVEAAGIHESSINSTYQPSSGVPANKSNESPCRASVKETLIFAQLSSVSAPARRITSYTTASATPDEDRAVDYENNLLSDQEEHQHRLYGQSGYQSESIYEQDGQQSQSHDRYEYQSESIDEQEEHQDQLSSQDGETPSSSHPSGSQNTTPFLGAPLPSKLVVSNNNAYKSSMLPPSKSWISETILNSSPQRGHYDTTISRFLEPFRKDKRD